jgi:hypothetical protein
MIIFEIELGCLNFHSEGVAGDCYCVKGKYFIIFEGGAVNVKFRLSVGTDSTE